MNCCSARRANRPPAWTNSSNVPCSIILSHVENENAGGLPHRRKPMRYDERGPTFHDFIERAHDFRFRIRIERARGLIENENWWVFEKRTSDRQALTFTARERTAASPRLLTLQSPEIYAR